MMQTAPAQTSKGRWPTYLMWALVAIAFANAFWYARVIANPMISADNWLFVDTFLRHAISGHGDLGDFLVKRAGLDHGQPLYKLSMLLNYRFFGLDLSLEALAGVVFGALGFLVLYRMVASDASGEQRNLAFCLAMAAVAAVHLSLNASMMFTFSMVTLGYLDYFLAFLVFYAAWRSLQGGSYWPFALAMLVYAIAGDTSATLTGAALAAALVLVGWRLSRLRPALQLIGIIFIALLVSRLVYAFFGELRGSTQAAFNAPFLDHITALVAQANEAWRWIITPAASGVAYLQTLQYFFGPNWQGPQLLLGMMVVAAHLWFWWAAFRDTPRAASFAAICLMLLFYGYVFGLLYGRVFVRGAGYLDQPRYVSFYQIGIMALLLMAAARALRVPTPVTRHRQFTIAAAVLLLAIQVPLTRHAWVEARYIAAYYRTMAAQYGEIARNPLVERTCVDALTLCGLPPDLRVRVIDMLRRHRLNLFSPRFVAAHPELVAAAGPLPAPD